MATRALVVGGTGPTGPYIVNGLRARVQFVTEEREDPLSHKKVTRLRVPYSGYEVIG